MQSWFDGRVEGLVDRPIGAESLAEVEPTGVPLTVRGRASTDRAGWEEAREADAADLNRFLENGGEVGAFIAPLYSGADIAQCLRELRGFDDADVFLELVSDQIDAPLAALAEGEWAGASYIGEDAATFLHACADLEVACRVGGFDAGSVLGAMALAIAEELSPREMAAVLTEGVSVEAEGIRWREYFADREAVDHARDLLAAVEPAEAPQ